MIHSPSSFLWPLSAPKARKPGLPRRSPTKPDLWLNFFLFLFLFATCTIADDDSLIAKIPATCDGGTTATLVIHATKSTFPSPPGTLVFSRITKLQLERTLP